MCAGRKFSTVATPSMCIKKGKTMKQEQAAKQMKRGGSKSLGWTQTQTIRSETKTDTYNPGLQTIQAS